MIICGSFVSVQQLSAWVLLLSSDVDSVGLNVITLDDWQTV
jgi:hypothetical protein